MHRALPSFDFLYNTRPEDSCPDSKSFPLVVGETDSLTARREQVFEDAVFLDEIGDDVRLHSAHPGGERHEE